MKKISLGIISLAFAFTSPFVLAEDFPPTGSVSMSTVLKNLQSKGFVGVHEVKFDDGMFEAKAVDAKGQSVKVQINPTTGEIMSNKDSSQVKLTMLDAVKKAEAAGYQRIAKVESYREGYELKAFDKNNKEVELEVNATTGAINAKSDD